MKHFAFLIIFISSVSAIAQPDYNKLDDKGKKDGLWKGFYEESKRPRYEGTFSHGRETGTFTFYDDTKAKSVIATREFNKDNSCYTTFYNQKKNKVSEGREVGHLYEGEWKYYHEDLPMVMALENYKNGKLNGKRTVFYRGSGVAGEKAPVAEETNYVNGVKQGKYKKYTEKGDVLEDSNYKNGELDGPATYRDPLGHITAQGVFTNGKKTGKWQYFDDGKSVKTDNSEKIKKKKEPPRPKLMPE